MWPYRNKTVRLKKLAIFIGVISALLSTPAAAQYPAWQEMRVTSTNSWKSHLSIYGARLVWSDNRNNPGKSIYDIYCYDLAADTEFPLFIHPANQIKPEIYGDRVVFEDYRDNTSGADPNVNIYMYDFVSDTVTRITSDTASQYTPSIYQDNIFWHDTRNGLYDIYGYDLLSSTEFPLSTFPGSTKLYARSDENIVVWQDDRNGDYDVYAYDLDLESEFPLIAAPSIQSKPVIDRGIVVWEDHRDWVDSGANIIGYDLTTQRLIPVCTRPGPQYSPAIHNDIVVWQDARNDDADVYGFDLDTGREFPISAAPQWQYSPKVFGKLVAFIDNRNNHSAIYCATPLRIKSVAFDETTSTLHLSWYSLPGKQYQVHTGPAVDQLTTVFGPIPSAGLSTLWQTVIAPDTPALFCRVKLLENQQP